MLMPVQKQVKHQQQGKTEQSYQHSNRGHATQATLHKIQQTKRMSWYKKKQHVPNRSVQNPPRRILHTTTITNGGASTSTMHPSTQCYTCMQWDTQSEHRNATTPDLTASNQRTSRHQQRKWQQVRQVVHDKKCCTTNQHARTSQKSTGTATCAMVKPERRRPALHSLCTATSSK